MKKMIIFSAFAVGAILIYLLTGSWKIALVTSIVCLAYLAWLIRFELRFSGSEEDAENLQRSAKKSHEKRSKDNPTLH